MAQTTGRCVAVRGATGRVVRVNSWASGGLIPPIMRGRKLTGLVALWDWYGTFAALAGVDQTDHRAAAAGLPPVDSVNQWPWISGQTDAPPRRELAIGGCAEPHDTFCTSSGTIVQGYIMDDGHGALWKLLVGEVWQDGYTGPDYPNNSIVVDYNTHWGHCNASGCLFELHGDPTEHSNLAAMVAHAPLLEEMHRRLAAANATVFSPDRGTTNLSLVCDAAARYGRDGRPVWGPFVK